MGTHPSAHSAKDRSSSERTVCESLRKKPGLGKTDVRQHIYITKKGLFQLIRG